ncbi:hypothetical protein LMC01_01995, partial [Limosilactobacillus reuteri]|uniref:Rib/alpha-like domain-containing protein n=1 Tax=Limosilactobacillus reuteri TaxID=1598 RepID=UPI001E5495D0
VVTYPDTTQDEVPVHVTVKDDAREQKDNDKYDPQGQDQTVKKGDQPNAGDSIANKDDLPEGTEYTWKET